MKEYRLNFPNQVINTGGRIAGWDRNALDSLGTEAEVEAIFQTAPNQVFAQLEAEDGTLNGVGFAVVDRFENGAVFTGSTGWQPATSIAPFAIGCFNGILVGDINLAGKAKFFGVAPGASYTLIAQCHQGNPDSATNLTVNGVTQEYVSTAIDGPAAENLQFTGTADANGEIIIEVAKGPSGTNTKGGIGTLQLFVDEGVPAQTIRKSSTFDVETSLGTITTATLNSVNVFDHVTGPVGTTVSFEGAATDEITTSGEYTLTLGDGTGTENITVQVNVFGVAPSNNPVQKDGSALASLTGVQVRVTDGANINGTQLYYSGTATTDASGNLSNIDLSSTSAADTDPVLLHMLTSAGDSIIASETVGLI